MFKKICCLFIWFLGIWSECIDLKDAIKEYRKAKSYCLSIGGFEKYADLAKERIKRSKIDSEIKSVENENCNKY